jgi:hypothetical protein
MPDSSRAMSAKATPVEDHRRKTSALLAASGLRAELASRLADALLWFDSAGLSALGLATLPDLLDGIARGEIDPKAEPKVGPERASAAVLDGRGGPPLLVLARAAELAAEKAREYGSGLIRVKGIGPVGSAAAAVFDVAIGPAVGMAAGPGGAWSMALPSLEGLPLIADAALGSDPSALAAFAPWSPLLGPGEWIVQAVSVPALEPLMSFHARVSEFAKTAPGTILVPARLEELRREARERGVGVSKAAQAALRAWGDRLGVS